MTTTQTHIPTGFTYADAVDHAAKRVESINGQKLVLQAEIVLAHVAAFARSDDKTMTVTAKRIKQAMLDVLMGGEGMAKTNAYDFAKNGARIASVMVDMGYDCAGTLAATRDLIVNDWKAKGLTIQKLTKEFAPAGRGKSDATPKSAADKVNERVAKAVGDGEVSPSDLVVPFEAVIANLQRDRFSMTELDSIMTEIGNSVDRLTAKAEAEATADATAKAA